MQRVSEREKPKNGATPVAPFAPAGGAPALYDDPMSKVLGLDARTSTVRAWFGFTSGSTLLLVGMMAFASVVAWYHSVHDRLAASVPEEIDVIKEDAPPPPQPDPEVKPEPAVAPPQRPREVAPPPPPAQAAKVLTQEPDPNEPVDLTGNTIVQGTAEAYAGGFTSPNGTNGKAVRELAVGVPGGTGPSLSSPHRTGPDLARPASVGNTDWNRCPFPTEADTAQIDDAFVTLRIDIRADGTPATVRVMSDPGNGFGREARQYAMRQIYAPARDHDGTPIAGTTTVKVHFSR
jgi:protein TonB